METKNRFYLNEKMWTKISPLLPSERGRCARPSKSNRLMVEAVIHKLRAGCPWRDLPKEFGPWESVYSRFSRWSKSGIWDQVFIHVKDELDNTEVVIDSTSVKAHQHAHGAQKKMVRKI